MRSDRNQFAREYTPVPVFGVQLGRSNDEAKIPCQMRLLLRAAPGRRRVSRKCPVEAQVAIHRLNGGFRWSPDLFCRTRNLVDADRLLGAKLCYRNHNRLRLGLDYCRIIESQWRCFVWHRGKSAIAERSLAGAGCVERLRLTIARGLLSHVLLETGKLRLDFQIDVVRLEFLDRGRV